MAHWTLHPEARAALTVEIRQDVAQHFIELVGIRTHLGDGLLCPTQLGSRHHLHRLGDLLGVLYRSNPIAYFFKSSCHDRGEWSMDNLRFSMADDYQRLRTQRDACKERPVCIENLSIEN